MLVHPMQNLCKIIFSCYPVQKRRIPPPFLIALLKNSCIAVGTTMIGSTLKDRIIQPTKKEFSDNIMCIVMFL
ncbi:hypothetical protein A3Q35_13580 [Aeribacillus pallidus]|jgi:hypothetical protein|nr:hypothetical protein A3Q35_13580 [Aeribacillus pallidus]